MIDPYDPTEEFSTDGGDEYEYPTVDRIYGLHDAVAERDENVESGVVNEGQIANALDYIQHGAFGEKPEGLFGKSAYLMKKIIQGHEFTDGNKRTGLYAAKDFIEMNGYEVEMSPELIEVSVHLAEGKDVEETELEEMWKKASNK
jgi:death-on-curing protein